jgi:hypothetical protein
MAKATSSKPAMASPSAPRNTYRVPLTEAPSSATAPSRSARALTSSACTGASAIVIVAVRITAEPRFGSTLAVTVWVPSDSRLDSSG